MSKREKDRRDRRADTAEFFTDPVFITEYVKFKNLINNKSIVVEPTAGNGRWLEPFKQTTDQLSLAVDIVSENCVEIIEKLYGAGKIEVAPDHMIPSEYKIPGLFHMFTHNKNLVLNVVCGDATEFNFLKVFNLHQINTFGNGLFEIE